MPPPAHARLSMIGDLPDGEMFSCNLSLVPNNSAFGAAIDAGIAGVIMQLLNEALVEADFDDLVTDVSNFWSRATSNISESAVLRRVKLASIDATGHYGAPPVEASVNVPGAAVTANDFPHQMARKITLITAGDLGRVKGGFYLPGQTAIGFDFTTNLYSVGNTEGVRDSVATLLGDIENEPGVDQEGWKVVVASGGRHNDNGTVRVPPRNHDVTAVNVGRRIDVQRRRANKLNEARVANASF